MPYTATDLREAVRALVRIRPSAVPDSDLDRILLLGRRRLEDLRPREAGYTITGTGNRSYKLTDVATGWENDFSRVTRVYNPSPDWNADDDPVEVAFDDYVVRRDTAGNDWIRIRDGITIGASFDVFYTARWEIQDLDGALETTLPSRYKNAIEFLCAAYLCAALAAENAGTQPRQFQGTEFLDVTNIQRRYRDQATAFREAFNEELRLLPGVTPAAIVRDSLETDREVVPYLTHRVNRGV